MIIAARQKRSGRIIKKGKIIMNTLKIDAVKRQKTKIAAILRVIVAVCIGFFGVKLLTNKDTTMNMATALTFGVLFILAAIGIAVYTIYRFYSDYTSAHIRKESFDDDDRGNNK